MPPYSCGQVGGPQSGLVTFALISSRSSMLWWRARSRSSPSSSPDRWVRHSASSLGRISVLMNAAVRSRTSLTAGSRPGIGVTLIATGVSFVRRWVSVLIITERTAL